MTWLWPLQDTKNKLSQVRETQKESQVITVRGEEKTVPVSAERCRELICRGSLISLMQAPPWNEAELERAAPGYGTEC